MAGKVVGLLIDLNPEEVTAGCLRGRPTAGLVVWLVMTGPDLDERPSSSAMPSALSGCNPALRPGAPLRPDPGLRPVPFFLLKSYT